MTPEEKLELINELLCGDKLDNLSKESQSIIAQLIMGNPQVINSEDINYFSPFSKDDIVEKYRIFDVGFFGIN